MVLSSNKIIDKGPEYDFIHPWLATGLLTSTGKLKSIKNVRNINPFIGSGNELLPVYFNCRSKMASEAQIVDANVSLQNSRRFCPSLQRAKCRSRPTTKRESRPRF